MSKQELSIADYPIAENRPELVRGHRGKSLDEVTLDSIVSGEIGMEDLRITAQALQHQAQISRAAGRAALAANFERAAEMTTIPQSVIMQFYELLRPGRAGDKQALLDVAEQLRRDFNAHAMAAFIEEAAEVYDRRGLYKFRY